MTKLEQIRNLMIEYNFGILHDYTNEKEFKLEFINDEKIYVFIDVNQKVVKVWQNDISGQRPIYFTDKLMKMMSDIYDVLNDRYNVLDAFSKYTDVYSHLDVIQMNIAKRLDRQSYELITNYMKGVKDNG